MTHTMEAGISALVVMFCLMYAVSSIASVDRGYGTGYDDAELRMFAGGALKTLDDSGFLEQNIQNGDYAAIYNETRQMLPEDVGFRLFIDGKCQGGDTRQKERFSTVSHRFVAALDGAELKLHDVSIVAWWR